MRIKINIYIIISLLLSTISLLAFLFFSILFRENLILYLGLPFTLAIFIFFSIFLNYERAERIFKVTFPFDLRNLIVVLTISSLFAVLLVPSFNGSMFEWMKISPLNCLRYLSSLLLTSFLPGYFLLKIMDQKQEIEGCATIVISYLLSLFISFFVGFFVLLSGNSIISLSLPIVITLNLVLVITYYFRSQKTTKNYLLTINPLEFGLILSIFTTIMVGSLVTMNNCMPLTSGDMRNHYGTALQFSQGFPSYGGKLIAYEGGYLFHIYLTTLFASSGIPPALAEQGLYLLSFMPILAFYTMAKSWLYKEDGKLPLIATFLSILLGFGGLYALYIRFTQPTYNIIQLLSTTTSKTYDVYMRILYLPDIVAPIWNIGLPVLFTLLYFLKKDASITKAVIVSLLVALGWLGHIVEIPLFIGVLLVYTIFIRRSTDKFGPYVILGLLIVVIIDFAAPAHIYISNVRETFSSPFFTSLLLAILVSIMELLKGRQLIRFSVDLKNSLVKKLEVGWRYGRWVILYAYIFFLIVWFALEKDFNLWIWGGYSYTPFFILPLRLGAAGMLAIVSIFLYFAEIVRNRNLMFFLLLIPLGLILEQIANYYSLGYPAYRFATLTFIGVVVVAAFGIIKAINIISIKRKTITCVFLTLLMIASMLSTTLYYINASYYTMNNKLSQDELTALDYIRENVVANASVLTFTTESANRLRTFTGLNAVQDAQRWSNLLLTTSNPYIITYVLGLSNIKYIYLTKKDAELASSNNVLKSIINYYPKVIENDHATIYKVHPLTPPSTEASLGVLYFPPSMQKHEASEWVEDSFTDGWYPYRQYGKVKNYMSKIKNGTMAVSVTSNQPGTVWASYALSNLSLNTTTYPIISFRYRAENNLTWFTLQLLNSSNKVFFYKGHLTDKEFTTKVFSLPENQTITKTEIVVETVKDAPTNTTAQACIGYIKFLSQTASWSDDNFLDDWEFYGKYGDVLNWSAYSDGEKLKLNVNPAHGGNVWISYSHPLYLKTKDSTLSFRYKVDNDYTWFTIILQTALNRFFFYKGHLTDKTFTTKSFSLPDDQTITRVEIIVETTDKTPAGSSAIAYLDNIEISQKPFSTGDVFPALFTASLQSKYSFLYADNALMKTLDIYTSRYTNLLLTSDPPLPIDSLTKWISTGNNLVVLNTYGNGFFGNLFEINESTPLLLIRNIGFGKVLYVNSVPAIKAGRESELLQPELLEKIREVLTLNKYAQKVDVLPVYNSTFGGIEVNGDLEVYTDILKLNGSLDSMDSLLQFTGSGETNVLGKVSLTIKNASLFIYPSESYLIIKPEKYPVEGEILVNGSNNLIISDGNVIYNSAVYLCLLGCLR